jgi:hypothetical protein
MEERCSTPRTAEAAPDHNVPPLLVCGSGPELRMAWPRPLLIVRCQVTHSSVEVRRGRDVQSFRIQTAAEPEASAVPGDTGDDRHTPAFLQPKPPSTQCIRSSTRTDGSKDFFSVRNSSVCTWMTNFVLQPGYVSVPAYKY